MSSLTGDALSSRFLLASQPINRRLAALSAALAALLVLAMVVSAAHGAARIPYDDVARLVLRGLGLPVGLGLPESQMVIVNQVRLPRILVSALAGAALASAGVTLQSTFRNPLADPSIIGVSVGGSLGAVVAITLGLATAGMWLLPLFAFAGSMGAAVLVYVLSLAHGHSQPATLLLAGVAVNAFLGAVISALLLFTNQFPELQAMLNWLIGGLRGRGWAHAAAIVGPVVLTVIALSVYARDMNLLLLGEETAQGLGVNVGRTRLALLALAALATGSAVSIAGPIGFVGLVVPHMLRLIVGPDHRVLLPASALGGALFLVVMDTIARLVIQPAEMQVGIITNLLGAPFFLLLLYRNRSLLRTL
jgi:iron complex transport system permease protein